MPSSLQKSRLSDPDHGDIGPCDSNVDAMKAPHRREMRQRPRDAPDGRDEAAESAAATTAAAAAATVSPSQSSPGDSSPSSSSPSSPLACGGTVPGADTPTAPSTVIASTPSSAIPQAEVFQAEPPSKREIEERTKVRTSTQFQCIFTVLNLRNVTECQFLC